MSTLLRRTACLSRTLQTRTGSGCPLTDPPGPGSVSQSQSTDVFQNSASEDWIEANVDSQRRGVSSLWRNRPAVVVGRHQNPWAECDSPAMRRRGVRSARRRSGGGAVYHDSGNLNSTFFASKKAYDRRRNSKVSTEASRRLRPQSDVRATDRSDVLLDGHYKISGTASRLSRTSSYHHCTLLHSVDRSALSSLLRPSCPGIHSNATPSVPSPVANLIDHAPSSQWEELLEALVQQYNSEFGLTSASRLVDPSDAASFPGVDRMEAELRGWEWTFGKTPKFRVETQSESRDEAAAARCSARLRSEVKNGSVESCRVEVPEDWSPPRLSGAPGEVSVGERFCPHRAAAALATSQRSEVGESQGRSGNLCEVSSAAMG